MERKKILINKANPILFGKNAYDQLDNLIIQKSYSKILIFSDFETRKYCLPVLESKIKSIIELTETHNYSINSGETNKNLESAKIIWQFLIEKGFKRNSLIINLGGGMITDLGGFIASAYMRGVDFVNIPTSLLGMVDASIGGKTGINIAEGKNLIGAIYQPSGVFIDPKLLDSLPKDEVVSGLGEVIKYGAIRDRKFLDNVIIFSPKAEIFLITLPFSPPDRNFLDNVSFFPSDRKFLDNVIIFPADIFP